jgi:AcrR family transcriptional regulator
MGANFTVPSRRYLVNIQHPDGTVQIAKTSAQHMATNEIPLPQQTGKNRKAQAAAATRDRLLQAAIHVIQHQGIDHLTLDAVAKEAQVSKGGLLYHFASKEALALGVIQYLMDDFDAAINHELALDQGPDSPGKWLRAYVKATFNYTNLPTALVGNLLSAITLNPELLQPIQDRFSYWQQQCQANGLDPVRANLVRLTADGLGTSDLFGINLLHPDLRLPVLELLLDLILAAESSDR